MHRTAATLVVAACGMALDVVAASADSQRAEVTVSWDMAEAAVDWLELVAEGADEATLRQTFFREVAPTAGCQAIIAHWARFREWDEEVFYEFILEALERKPSDAPLVDENGHPTRLGHARRLWTAAVADVPGLRRDLAALRAADVRDRALERARAVLPPSADISNRFHVVLFGASNAFSVGEDNGFDLLQLARTVSGEVDVERVVAVFAHEMHHSGLAAAMGAGMGELAGDPRLNLPGLLVAEGMATYYLTPPFEHLSAWRTSDDPGHRQLAADWDRHLENLESLYARAEADIARGLAGDLSTDELVSGWLGGMQGPGYVLGVDMIRTIDTELGRHATVALVSDSRALLATYNRAAWLAGRDGTERPRFSDELARRLERYGEEETDRQEHPSVALPPDLARVLRDYERAWRAEDAVALAALFAEDGFVLSGGHPPIRGRDRIRERYRDSGGPLSLRALDYATAGDIGYIIGAYSRAEGDPDLGKFTLTLRRGDDGRWLIVSDMDTDNQRR